MLRLSHFIDGQYVEPSAGSEFLPIYEPATGKIYGEFPNATALDVDNAVAAARRAFPAWASKTAAERSALLYRVADILESRIPEFAAAESKDQGKTLAFASRVDIPRAVYNFRFFAGHILHSEEHSSSVGNEAINYTVSQPVGIAGLISPWNLPLYLLTWKIAPAIAAGNTCVCKPSEMTSVTAWMLCQVLNDAGVPAGVVNMVFGTGPSAGAPLVRHPDVKLISFTGGTVTGQRILADSAEHCKKVSLELGGKNPAVVFEDADLAEAVPTSVQSAFSNQGEICLCNSRIFVHESIYAEFVERFVQEASKLVVGDPKDPKTTVGALVSADHMAKVLSYIDLAREEGGTIALGGGRAELEGELAGGYFVKPTVITGLAHDTRVQQEEIFGPVVCIYPFSDEQQVIDWANSVKYGLSASVWTRDIKRAQRVALKLQSGTVWINCWLVRDLRMPFGGMKMSGVGREGGKYSLEFFTEQKTVCIKYT